MSSIWYDKRSTPENMLKVMRTVQGWELTEVLSIESRSARTGVAAATSGWRPASAPQALARAARASEEASFPDKGARRSAYSPA